MTALPVTAPLPARNPTVLVVDDNPALQQLAQGMLAQAGIGCCGAADSIAALCALAEHPLATVLIDADCGPLLPWQFAALLRQHPVHGQVRLVYTSTRDDVIERARALAAGIDAFLAKPFTAEELLAALGTPLATAA
ncbi:MAG TPA: response regulator [Candidatus Acidoferrum sp.]|nr:response regulator [Candidatus Acidoferrum sp.]